MTAAPTEGLEVPIHYDPLVSKLITWGDDRGHALARMKRALAEYEVVGIRTTIPFFQWVLEDADFVAARFDTTFIDRKLAERNGTPFQTASADEEDLAAVAAALHIVLRAPASTAAPAAPPSRWRHQARVESLR